MKDYTDLTVQAAEYLNDCAKLGYTNTVINKTITDIANHQVVVMENWSPKDDPRYQDMGAEAVTIYCYPNGTTYAVTGTQSCNSITYVVEGLQAALCMAEFVADSRLQFAYASKSFFNEA